MWLIAVVLGLCSTLFFLQGISNPSLRIFDEEKYVDPANAMLTSTTDTSPDGPPLGKLILAGSISLLGDNSLGWRAASALFGGLVVAGVFVLGKLLLNDTALALAAVAISIFNNFLFVFSRSAMMDIFFFAFALWSVVTFVAAVNVDGLRIRQRRLLLACTGLLLGLSGACKWNAVDELCVFLAISVGLFLASRRKANNLEIARCLENMRKAGVFWIMFSLLLLPALPYVLSFWPYCRMLRLPFSWSEFAALHAYIWRFHLTVAGDPAITEAWYKWPFRTQPLRAFSYLVGNWYVMWAGLVALLFCLRRFCRNLPETLIVLLYFANLLQWAVTPQSCLYYYYYFPAAMFLGMAIPVALHRLPSRVYGVRLSVATVLPALCIFAFCFGQMAHLPAPYDCMLGCWP
jgi:dolichyl-phosphate-mannose-protein mannosyltransferase